MEAPVTIKNVHNISLESLSDESDGYPHLVALISCEKEIHECINLHWYWADDSDLKVCCATLWLYNVYNVSVKGISITVQTSRKPISAVILRNVSDISAQVNAICSLTGNKSIGVTVYEATFVEVLSSTAHNCSFGLVLRNSTNTYITRVTALNNEFVGIALDAATDTHINSILVAHNTDYGMCLTAMNNTHIGNMITAHNGFYGIRLSNMNDTHITNMTTAHNDWDGMLLSTMNNTHITNMTATHNTGYGMYLLNMSNTYISSTNTVHNGEYGMELSSMKNTHIANTTTAYNGGNGMYLSTMNNTHITKTTVAHNDWDGVRLSNMSNTHITNMTSTHNNGVGMYLSAINNTHMTETTATHNGRYISTRIGVFDGQVIIMSSSSMLIYNTSFTDVSAQSTSSTEDPTSLPAVIVVYQSTLHVSGCAFTRNIISAIVAYASNITVSSDLTFSNNRALAGTAFILVQDSILTSTENNRMYFVSNHATNIGGVFYISSNNLVMYMYNDHDINYYSRSTCFINTEGNRYQTRFTFVNNSAVKGGDILYGGRVAYGLDGDWNCLDSFKNISNISQNGLSLISSDPSRVCLCSERGQPDCLAVVDPTPRTIHPGQTINISAVVVGQDFGTVSGSVYAQFLQKENAPWLESGQEAQGVAQYNCNDLYYTISSQSEVSEAMLVLTAQDSSVSKFLDDYTLDLKIDYYNAHAVGPLVYSSNPVYINISLLPCPPGFMLTTDTPFKCDCDALLQQMHGVECYIQEQTIGRSGLQWVGIIQDDNGTNGTVAISEYCSLDYCNTVGSNVTLSDPDSQCNYNHSGTLCGGCQPGLSLALGSAQCLPCSNKYLALLIPFAIAGPALVFSIKLLDVTISQGTLNGLIFYANVVKTNEFIFLPQGQTNPLTVFIAWLNLDLGVETCIFQGLTAYSKAWLQFVFPFYIWSIAGLIIILARYSDMVAKVMGNNSVPVLATLFLLSYAKLLRTIITALSYTVVYTSHGPKAVWTADGNVDFLGSEHTPLFATAVVLLLFLWLPYTLLLFLGQWLYRCNCRLIVCMLMKIKPFLDAHYGPLKSKHRYWFGALLLVRAAILLTSALVPANRSSIIVLCISITAVVLTYFGHLVYHKLAVAMFDIASFMNLALLTGAYSFTTTVGGSLTVSAYTLIGVAFIQFVGLAIVKVFFILRRSEKVMECLRKGQPVQDNWELYEQAALLREMESDSEEEDSEGSGSYESLPTY